MKRALEEKKVVENVNYVEYKRLDLRKNSRLNSFNCQKFEFAIVHNKENIATYSTDTPRKRNISMRK